MPDLSRKGAHEFWSQYPDTNVYRVIAFMEGVEHWTADDEPAFEEALSKLGESLDSLDKVDLSQLGRQDVFIKIACHMKAARVLKLLQSIDAVHPGAASKLLIHAEETSQTPDDAAGLFLRRNIVFERLRLLSRIFEPKRAALLLKAIEGDEHV